MSPEEQRIAIAEACGWTQVAERVHPLDETITVLSGRFGGKEYVLAIPYYPIDLNAMHEAEKTLGNGRLEPYGEHLKKLCCKAHLDWVTGRRNAYNTAEGHSFHATAAQRAEAFLKTIGKWKQE